MVSDGVAKLHSFCFVIQTIRLKNIFILHYCLSMINDFSIYIYINAVFLEKQFPVGYKFAKEKIINYYSSFFFAFLFFSV